jgi:hypothetical protein
VNKKKSLAVGQVYYDVRGAGFSVVRGLSLEKTAIMSGPTDFWNDAHTCAASREVQVAAIMEPDWEGPFDSPETCPRAHLCKWGYNNSKEA